MLTTKVLFLGIDAVGKTSLLYKLKLNENIQTIPTIGFNVESIDYKNRKIYMWDIGGGGQLYHFWSHYMKNSNCLIFVIDVSTKDRINEYIESFQFLLDQHKDIRNIPIIIFNNKKNDKKEFESEEILKKVNMPPEIAPQILEGNVFSGEGLPELLEYIYNNIEFKEEIIKEEEENEKKEKNDEKEENENKNKKNKVEGQKVCMFGLSGAGKTTILYLLKIGEKVTTIPTIGFNVETFENENCDKNIEIWDVGGMTKIRPLWKHYLSDIKGLIWVYDISNEKEIEESQNELINILTDSKISQNIPLLIYANKEDLNKNESNIEIFINNIQKYIEYRPYYIQKCNINDLESYKNGLSWLYNNMN
jgi:ADP-ribosylation factor protein 6